MGHISIDSYVYTPIPYANRCLADQYVSETYKICINTPSWYQTQLGQNVIKYDPKVIKINQKPVKIDEKVMKNDEKMTSGNGTDENRRGAEGGTYHILYKPMIDCT